MYGAVARTLRYNRSAHAFHPRSGVRKEYPVVVTISSRHMDVTPALKNYAEQKAGKLNKYYDLIQEIEVVFDAGKDATRVEMIVNAEHNDRSEEHTSELQSRLHLVCRL